MKNKFENGVISRKSITVPYDVADKTGKILSKEDVLRKIDEIGSLELDWNPVEKTVLVTKIDQDSITDDPDKKELTFTIENIIK